jgi:hypothetical protein
MSINDDGFWDQVKGNWKQLKGKVREKWGLLTNDDFEHKVSMKLRRRHRKQAARPGSRRSSSMSPSSRRQGYKAHVRSVEFGGQVTPNVCGG